MDPADPEQVSQHPQRVSDHGHLALGTVEPEDRDLRDGDAAPPREIQDLDVVSDTVDAGAREEVSRDVGPEELETALRVSDPGDRDQTNESVEGLPHELPIERLPLPDEPFVDGSRADRHRGGRETFRELRSLLEPGRQIRLGDAHRISGRGEYPGPDRGTLSAVPAVTQNRERQVVTSGRGPGELGRSIRGPVVDDAPFPLPSSPAAAPPPPPLRKS